MRQAPRVQASAIERPDLRAAEGVMAGIVISAMLWMMLLVSLY